MLTLLFQADLIAGLTGEDIVSFGRGFDQMRAAEYGKIQLGILKCLPGTTLSIRGKDMILRWPLRPPYEILKP
ncbi:MAG: hypothetical protein LBU18_06385 [Treponema sp.]|jgi:hypothetical protein|nr:hypothetical protein [Treponema sp.]